jgi:uncharacterized protein YceK
MALASSIEGGKMKYLILALGLTTLTGCATVNTTMQEYYDKTIYKITEYECKMFDAEKFGRCMREHYPRVEEDYSWQKKDEVGSDSKD